MVDYLILFAMGLAGGFLAGLIGIGGGVMYVLILPYLLTNMGFPSEEIVQYTIANSLVGTMFAALSGNLALIKRKEFYWKEVAVMGAFGAFLSLSTLYFVVNTSWYQRDKFNWVIIGLVLFIIFKTLKQSTLNLESQQEAKQKKWMFGVTGSLAGAVSALSGLGGGVIIIPILNSGFKMTMQKAKSISLGVIFITSLSLSVFNLFEKPITTYANQNVGYIVMPLALALSIGVALASPFGVMVARKLPSRVISYIFVIFLLVVIIDKAIQVF